MLQPAQTLAKVKYWTATVAAKLCSNLCMCSNFLALEIRTKCRKIVNNYGYKLNKQESKAKLSFFKTECFFLVTYWSDMTIKPKKGKKISCSDYLSRQRKGDSKRSFLRIWALKTATLVLFNLIEIYFCSNKFPCLSWSSAIMPAFHLLGPCLLGGRKKELLNTLDRVQVSVLGSWPLFGLKASAGCTATTEMQERREPHRPNQHNEPTDQ